MSRRIATRRVITSKGAIPFGGEIPSDLPKEEWDRIKAAKGYVNAADEIDPETDDEESAADRDALVAAAIAELADADFTEAGLPKTSAISAKMPEGSEPVSAAERDHVWAAVMAERPPET